MPDNTAPFHTVFPVNTNSKNTKRTDMKFYEFDKMSDVLRKAAEQEIAQASAEGEEYALLEALERIAKRIDAGEAGLYDPDNTGDCLCLILARFE